MQVVLGNGGWAIFSAMLVIVGAVALRAARGRSARWRWACVICPLLAALAATLALSKPVWQWNPKAGRVVILLDLSPSTRTSPWRDPYWVRGQALRHLAAGTRMTVVGFAGQTQVLLADVTATDAALWPIDWPAVAGAATNLQAAFEWRDENEIGSKALAPRWLITDGLVDAEKDPVPFNDGGDLKGTGPFHLAVTAVAPATADVGVAEILIKRAATAGAPTELWVRVRATGAAKVDVDLYRDDERLVRQPVDFAGIDAGRAGDRWISVRTQDLPGDRPTRLTARLSPRAGANASPTGAGRHVDPWPENDEASLLYLPDGPPRVLVVGAAAQALEGELVKAGLRARGIRASQMPSDSTALVAQGWQVVVLDNVPMKAPMGSADVEALAPGAARALDAFVQRTGGGLVLAGGRYAFGPGYYPDGDGTLEKLSPLASQPPKRPGARVIFLLDASASMNEAVAGAGGAAGSDRKFSLVAKGVESALELLQAQDEITVITFNGAAAVQASGLKADVDQALEKKLREVRPQGTTTPDTALPLLEPLLPGTVLPGGGKKPGETMTMVVLLTDGEIPKIDLPAWKALLSRSGAMLTVVAPTPTLAGGGELDALPDLAKENHATWLALDGSADWTILLRRAVAERLMGRARTEPLAWKSQAPSLEDSTSRWIETYLKPDATPRATGVLSTPGPAASEWAVAAAARRGLGQVAALPMDADTPATRALLAQLIRDVAPPAGDRRFALAARRQADGWLLHADGRDEHAFLNGLHLRARILSAAGDERVVDMPQTGPGTYEAAISAPAGHGGALAAIITRDAGEGPALVGTLRPPDVQTDEYPASVERTSLPEGAVVLAADDATKWSPRLVGWSAQLAPGLWVLAAALALAALWLRRGH